MSFYLSEETPYNVETENWARPVMHGGVFWQLHAHTRPARLGLVVMAGSRAIFPIATAAPGEVGLLVFGAALPEISADGLDVVIRLGGVEVYRRHLARFDANEPWHEVRLDLKGAAGTLSVECGTGTDGNPCGDWLAIYELVIAKPEELGLWRARAFREWRERNTIEAPLSAVPIKESGSRGFLHFFQKPGVSLSPPGPHRLASDLLQKELRRPIPNFAERLSDRIKHVRKDSALRVLSLCSGTADKELRLLQRVRHPERVTLTLVDARKAALEAARERLGEWCSVRTEEADVNALDLQGDRYDIILCAGGLNRLVELEHVVAEISRGLVAEGEFWSIGQYAGRNGARLWPEAYSIANPFFRRLPERYRVNHSWPDRRCDTDLPNMDFSIGTLGNLRSEEIEPILSRLLLPHAVTKQACFVWRFFDAAYRENFDVNRQEDVAAIRRAVMLDAEHQRQGGRPANLDGVYRRRM